MPSRQIPTLTDDDTGTIVTFTVPQEEVHTIARYKYDRAVKDIKQFVQETVTNTVRWMSRMTAGLEQYQLETMEHWSYDRRGDYLSMKTPLGKDVVFDMAFTNGSIEDYNQGIATILNGFWYKTYAVPTAVIELIASADLLYRERHKGESPGQASGIAHVDCG